MNIPYEIDMLPYTLQHNNDLDGKEQKDILAQVKSYRRHCPYCYRYVISGAIVHVDRKQHHDRGQDASLASSDGHYITYISTTKKGTSNVSDHMHQATELGSLQFKGVDINHNTDVWMKLDDEKVTPITVLSNDEYSQRIVTNEKRSTNPSDMEISYEMMLNMFSGGSSSSSPRYATSLSYSTICNCIFT